MPSFAIWLGEGGIERAEAVGGRYDQQHCQQEQGGGDGFCQQVKEGRAYGRLRTEDGTRGCHIVVAGKMFEVNEPYQQGTGIGAGNLRQHITRYERPRKFSHERQAYGNGGIEVRSACCGNGEYTYKYSDGPAEADYDPSAVIAFRFIEQYIGHHAIAEADQQGGSQKLGKIGIHHGNKFNRSFVFDNGLPGIARPVG